MQGCVWPAVRANAEKMLDRLKKAGFTGFVVEGTR